VHRPQNPAEGDSFTATADRAGNRPLGPDAAAILSSEHWSLLGTRSLIWNEAMSRATVFLTVLSASIIALAFQPTRPVSVRRPPPWRS
jgi:hypothetical protein